jgi:CBS domain-containing protein
MVSDDSVEFPGRRQHLFRGRRVKVRDLIDAGLLEAGSSLILDRPQTAESTRIIVTESGLLQLSDGRLSATPSGAIKDLLGKSVDGWYAWRTADDGQLLHALRQQLLDQAKREVSDDGTPALEARQDEFLASAKDAAEAGSPKQVTVRELIGIWGARGRDFGVNEQVIADLSNRGMTTVPDFRAVTLEDAISIILTTQEIREEVLVAYADTATAVGSSALLTLPVSDEEASWDHGLTIGNLPSASKKVCSVTPDATFDEAITLMLIEDYSQLAVMSGPRDLKGAVSWKSIAKARNANPDARLSSAIIKAEPVPYTSDLIDMLPVIENREFVFVVGADRSVTGIVTLADVVEVYGQMASPFFLIGRIDQSLRRIIESALPLKTVISLCDPDGQRDLSGFDQLTMGDYQRVLENPDCWVELGWKLHRKVFGSRLNEIARVRNNLMHFNNDPLPDDVVSMMQHFLDLLLDYGK